MLRAVANLKYFAHVRWFVWGGVIFLMVWTLLVEWHRVQNTFDDLSQILINLTLRTKAFTMRRCGSLAFDKRLGDILATVLTG